MSVRGALLAAALAWPAAAGALEPRFDHRDTHGPVVEALFARDTLASSSRGSLGHWRPALRVGWGFDATGEGSEILLAADVALRSFSDPNEERVLLAANARFRSYFGTEELKTFFEAGVWVPIRSRLSVGPMVGLGLAYDFTRRAGAFVAGEFATAFGQGRMTSLGVLAGVQVRFELL